MLMICIVDSPTKNQSRSTVGVGWANHGSWGVLLPQGPRGTVHPHSSTRAARAVCFLKTALIYLQKSPAHLEKEPATSYKDQASWPCPISAYVCICAFMHVCAYVSIYASTYLYIYVRIYASIYLCIDVYTYTYIYIFDTLTIRSDG